MRKAKKPQLLLLYGPPAVGKLTIANAIAKKTDFRVFHNHLTIDALKPALERGEPNYGRTVNALRRQILRVAVKTKKNIILTYVYAIGAESGITSFARTWRAGGGDVVCIQLVCSEEHLLKRVESPSRKKTTKIQTKKDLRGALRKYTMHLPHPREPTTVIDTTNKSVRSTVTAVLKVLKQDK